jgi:hypothetical protein
MSEGINFSDGLARSKQNSFNFCRWPHFQIRFSLQMRCCCWNALSKS